MERTSPRGGNALRETAKLAPAQPARKARPISADSSGIVDLEALMAQQPNWLDDALARARSNGRSPSPSLAPGLLAPPSLSPSSLAPVADGDEMAAGVPRTRGWVLVLGALMAVGLVVGACAFAWKVNRARYYPNPIDTSLRAAATAAPAHLDAPAVPAAAPLGAIPPPPAETPLAAASDPAQPAPAADPQATATADSEPATPGHHKHGKHGRLAARLADAPDPAPAAAAAPPAPRPAAHVSAPAGPLEAALRAAAGPGPSPAAAAPAAPPVAAAPAAPKPPPADGRPERPSGSAVTSALTAALGAARGCLSSDDGPSRALVTFASEGSVRRVDVSGPAASNGKASSCLRSAFARAHVPPFSASSYSAGVTVRPN
jgi:hypothetical protein